MIFFFFFFFFIFVCVQNEWEIVRQWHQLTHFRAANSHTLTVRLTHFTTFSCSHGDIRISHIFFFLLVRGLWCTKGTPTMCLQNRGKNFEVGKKKVSECLQFSQSRNMFNCDFITYQCFLEEIWAPKVEVILYHFWARAGKKSGSQRASHHSRFSWTADLGNEPLMSAHLVKSTRLALATYRCFIVTSMYSCAAHGVRIDPCLDTVHGVISLHARCIQPVIQPVYSLYCRTHNTRVLCTCVHCTLARSQAWLRAIVQWTHAYVLCTPSVCCIVACAAHSIVSRKIHAWGSFDALRSGVMNMHATPPRFAESKSGWEGYFQSAFGSWSRRASEKIPTPMDFTCTQLFACTRGMQKVNAVSR